MFVPLTQPELEAARRYAQQLFPYLPFDGLSDTMQRAFFEEHERWIRDGLKDAVCPTD